jgi:hypothetical protein
MNKSAAMLLAVLVAVLLGATGWYFWQQAQIQPQPQPVSRPVSGPVTSDAPAPAPQEPVILHPVQAIETPAPKADKPLPALADSDAFMKSELIEWLGRKTVLTFFQLDGIVRRIVATVDNLSREHAPPAMWPVQPTPGRFTTLAQGNGSPGETGEIINPDNSRRYTPFVLFIESVDMQQAVQLYVRLYPLFQQAYEELGYPRQYFNDRLVAVIDQLLLTPVHSGPVSVSLVDVKGPIASEHPWLRYEFTDPNLQALSAGQKILIRTGPANHRRLKARLLVLRKLLTQAALPALPDDAR